MAANASLVTESVERCLLRRNPEKQQVFFSNPSTGKYYFFPHQVSTLLFKDPVEVTYNSRPILLDQLDENTEATLTVEKRTITKVAVTLLRQKKSLLDTFREGFAIFTPQKFPTYLLEQEYMHDPQRLLVTQIISAKFSGIRKVLSDGGNGFWTALGLAFFEHLALIATNDDEIQYFRRLLRISGIQTSARIFTYLTEVQTAKFNPGCFPGELIDSWHNNFEFRTELVQALKTVTLAYAQSHQEHVIMEFPESGISGFEIELMHSKETSKTAIDFIASALPIKLVVHTLDSDNIRISYSSQFAHPKLAYIHLLKLDDCYYILYNDSWLNAEGYDLLAGKRRKTESLDSATVQSLYYQEKHHCIQFETREMNEEEIVTLSQQAESIQIVGKFIIAAFKVLQRQAYIREAFFDEDLRTSTWTIKNSYAKMLAQLSPLPPEVGEDVINALRTLEDSEVFNNLQVLKRCGLCHNEFIDILLKCGHGICKNCLPKRVEKQRAQKGSGSRYEWKFVCVVLDCPNIEQISERVLAGLLNDQFCAYLEEEERKQNKQWCHRCDEVYDLSKFLLSSCTCKLCVYCQLELTRTNSSVCICGVAFDTQAKTDATDIKDECGGCGRTQSLCRNFTSVRCSEHATCISCLEKAMKEADPRCKGCYRLFTHWEIKEAKQYFVRICDLDCGRFFDTSGALDLPCGCHYCERCATQRSKTSGTQNCYQCKQPLPTQITTVLERKQKEELFLSTLIEAQRQKARENYVATQCQICMSMIGYMQRFQLACKHVVHRECFKNYFENFVSAKIEHEITCPIVRCKASIPLNLLQSVAHPKDFEKYYAAVKRKD